jgi:hypothetical protein
MVLLNLAYFETSKKFEIPTWSRTKHNIISATLMLGLGNGLTALGEHTVPSRFIQQQLYPLFWCFFNY